VHFGSKNSEHEKTRVEPTGNVWFGVWKCKSRAEGVAAQGGEAPAVNIHEQYGVHVKVNGTAIFSRTQSYLRRLSSYIVLALALMVCPGAACVIVEGVTAVVNGDPILVSELEESLAPYRQQFASTYRGVELNDRIRGAIRTLLNQLVDQRLMLQEAERLGLSVSSKSIDEGMKEIRGRFSTEEEFQEALAKAGDKEDEVRDEVMKSLLLGQLMASKRRQFEDQVSVSEQEVQEHLDSAGESEAPTKQVELWQIWVAAVASDPDGKRADARRRCESILSELRSGADFEETARKVSEGPEREEGGLMGMVRQGEMQTELDSAAFSLAAGETSDVVESPAGFHILRVTRIDQPDSDQIADTRVTAEENVRMGKVEKMYEQWLAELRGKADISIK